MFGNCKIWLNPNAPSVVHYSSQPLSGRRRCDTGGPHNSLGSNPLVSHNYTFLIDHLYCDPQTDIDSKPRQAPHRCFGELFGKCGKRARSHINKNDMSGRRINAPEVSS
jgi:hypothetical protein